jgi:hypothetical protein
MPPAVTVQHSQKITVFHGLMIPDVEDDAESILLTAQRRDTLELAVAVGSALQTLRYRSDRRLSNPAQMPDHERHGDTHDQQRQKRKAYVFVITQCQRLMPPEEYDDHAAPKARRNIGCRHSPLAHIQHHAREQERERLNYKRRQQISELNARL